MAANRGLFAYSSLAYAFAKLATSLDGQTQKVTYTAVSCVHFYLTVL